MSTTVQFSPSTAAAFRFQPVIAGKQYTAIITWNVHGRYYLNLFDTSGNLVLSRPVVSSGPLVSATLTWQDTGVGSVATAVTAAPHNVPVGALANVRISQTDTPYDGFWQVLATGPNSLTFAIANPNEPQPIAGQLSFDVNLVAALGGGWLIYRFDVQQFEYDAAA